MSITKWENTQPCSFLKYIPLLTINTFLMIFAICPLLKQAFLRKCNGLFKIMKEVYFQFWYLFLAISNPDSSHPGLTTTQKRAEYSLTNNSCASIMGPLLFKLLGIIVNVASLSDGTQGHFKMKMKRWTVAISKLYTKYEFRERMILTLWVLVWHLCNVVTSHGVNLGSDSSSTIY